MTVARPGSQSGSTAYIMKSLLQADKSLSNLTKRDMDTIAIIKHKEASLLSQASEPNKLQQLSLEINHNLTTLDQIGTREAFDSKSAYTQQAEPLTDEARKRDEEQQKLVQQIKTFAKSFHQELVTVLKSGRPASEVDVLLAKHEKEIKNFSKQYEQQDRNIAFLESKLETLRKRTETAVNSNRQTVAIPSGQLRQ